LGIHGRHLDDGSRIRYISTDAERQVIPVVCYTDSKGKTIQFDSTDNQATKQQLEKSEHRAMDCVDCHNRPTHGFERHESAVDLQMSPGSISPELPYIRKKAVDLLKVNYPDRETARTRIIESVVTFYRDTCPDVNNTKRKLVEQSPEAVANIYL